MSEMPDLCSKQKPQMNKIALWISIPENDWTAESAITASNETISAQST